MIRNWWQRRQSRVNDEAVAALPVSAHAILACAVAVALLCLPFGMMAQGWLVAHPAIGADIVVHEVTSDPIHGVIRAQPRHHGH